MILIIPFIFRKGFQGITLFPFIILRNKSLKLDQRIINHEKIHIYQQLELLWFFFFIWYGIEFIYHWIKLKNANKAYRAISFEKEAYENDTNIDYLNTRKIWAFRKWL